MGKEPRSRKGARTRARLVDAAKEVFEEHGFLDVRMSDIAERAGLSHGALYHYFDSKEEIFREVVEALDARLSGPIDRAAFAPSADAERQRLLASILGHLQRYQDDARIMGVIEQVARYDDYVSAVRFAQSRRHREEIAGSIRRMQQRDLADARLDPAIAAAALASMVERFAEMWLVQGFIECELDAAAKTLATLFANALQLDDRRTGQPDGAAAAPTPK